MKILFLPASYFPNVSGVPVVVKYLAEGLSSKGHDVAVATQSFMEEPLEDVIDGVKVYRFKIWKDWKHCYKGDLNGFVKFVINYKADVNILECTQCITTDTLLPYLKYIRGRKYFHIHGISGLSPHNRLFQIKSDVKHTIGNTINWFSSQFYFGYKLRRAMPLFDSTICLSTNDDGFEYVKRHSRKNYVLDNAAENMFYDEQFCQRDVLGKYVKLANSRFMMSCANYSYIKNQQGIITEYFLSDSSKDTSLICIGLINNEYYESCKKLVSELEEKFGKRDIHLLYGVERNDIPAIINKSSIYLVGSYLEQYSISIIEAMSQSVPFISTNVGNARLLPGGITINRMGQMHQVIDRLLSDEKMYKDLSDKGRKYAYDNCRISVAVDKLERIISE